MSTEEQFRSTGAGSGDLLRELALGLAHQIDQLTAVIKPQSGAAPAGADHPGAGDGVGTDGGDHRITELLGEVGTLIGEIGDQIARLLATLIAVLEAIARALSSTPPAEAPATSGFQPIPVRISPARTTAGEAPRGGAADLEDRD